MINCGVIGSVNLLWIVPATVQTIDIVIRKVCHHLFELWVLPKKILAGVSAALCLTVLEFAVYHLVHHFLHETVAVSCE